MATEPHFNLTHKFLIALPGMGDHRFEKSVILICYHDQDGAMGIIINKPKAELKLSDMLSDIGIDGSIKVADTAVLDGGPVDIDRGFVLHSDDITAENDALTLKHGICLSSSREALEVLVTDDAPNKVLLAVGYAGWGGGQIEQEIQANAWMVAESDPSIVFNSDHHSKWEQAIRSIGIDPSMISSFGGQA